MAPELAVVMAYCKIRLFMRLLDSDLPEDHYLGHDLERYFPPPLPERYGAQMRGHRLRREIIATVVANQLVDRAGTTFAFRLGEETGAAAVAAGPRLRGRARGIRDARVLGDGRRPRQQGRGRDAAADADRGSAAGRARDALAGAGQRAARSTSRPTLRRFEPGARMLQRGDPRRARRRRPRVVRRARPRSSEKPASSPSSRRASPACRRCSRCSTSSRSRRRPDASRRP